MKYKTLDSYDFKDKRVLVRVDLNSEVIKGKVINSPRVKSAATTIKELQSKKAKVVVIAHQGRQGKDDFTDLQQHAKLLNKYTKIKFIDDASILGNKSISAIKNLKSGEAILLDNIRNLKEETDYDAAKSNLFVDTLTPLFDYYVNDAFSVSHRVQASIVGFPKKLPSCIGRTMEYELENVDKIKSKLNDCLFILGGAKPEDVSLLLTNKFILSTGVLANIALLLKGIDLGKEDTLLYGNEDLLDTIKKNLIRIQTPTDLAIEVKGKRKDLIIKKFPQNANVLDIGKKTIKEYAKQIKNAKYIFFKGSAGKVENKNFQAGTEGILKAIASSKAFSVVAGGHSTTALDEFKIKKDKIGYISLSGGALVHYIAGRKLPGLEALK